MTRRARLYAVVGIVFAGALGVVSSTQTWLVAALAGAAARDLAVPGAAAVPVLAPLSLAMLALGLALSIVGVVLRYAFGVLAVLGGGVLFAVTARVVIERPVSSVASAVTDATGITGADAVAALVETIRPTPWPAVTLAGWIVLIAAGVFTLVTARRWRGAARRYRAESSAPAGQGTTTEPLDAIDSWDGLSRGDDPTAGSVPR